MGLLGFFSKKPEPTAQPGVLRLPSGSFTLDPGGRIVASTLPQSFPREVIRQIGELVLSTFASARNTQLPVSQIVLHYAALKLTAKELRGGAIIFLAPRSLGQK